jgi:hypothetical protein
MVIPQKEEPVFACMDDSTMRLCDTRHIIARMVASLNPNDIEVINAMGAYSGPKVLVIKMIAVSPGNPTSEKSGERNPDISANQPEYSSNLTNKEMGNIIFNSQIQVLADLGNAFLIHNQILSK